jgi:glycosyltransferase involved in cell wall biosynthesis
MTAPRILALLGSGVVFGSERANVHALKELQYTGCTVHVLVREEIWARKSIIPFIEESGLDYTPVPFLQNRVPGATFSFFIQNPLRFVRAPFIMRAVVKKFQPSHICISNPLSYLSFIFNLEKIEASIIYRIGDRPPTHNPFWRWVWQRVAKRVTHFVANAEFVARELESTGVSRDRISIIYNSPTVRANPSQPEAPINEPQHILYIGQVSAHKGVDCLVEAFRLVAVEFPDAKLTVLGRISEWSGDAWPRSLRQATCSDPVVGKRVQFVGEQDDVYRYLAEAGFLVVPSVFEEPLANVVSEAKAGARASVVFPSGGLPEVIRHGEDGYVCRDKSVEALAEGLRFYLTDPERVRAHGRAALTSLKRLGSQQFAERWRAVYDKTLVSGLQKNSKIVNRVWPIIW